MLSVEHHARVLRWCVQAELARIGFADCDGNKTSNGCEINTNTDTAHCGGCSNKVCSSANIATTSCNGGLCNGSCSPGYTDCNNNKLSDGCETHTATDPSNCGTCNTACKYLECVNSACPAPTYVGVIGPGPQTQTFSAGSGGTITFIKVSIGSAGKLAALGMASKAAGHKAYLGLYTDSTGSPQTLIAQTGELTTTASGTEGILGALTAVSNTGYWIALSTNAPLASPLSVASENATTTAIYVSVSSYGPLPRVSAVGPDGRHVI